MKGPKILFIKSNHFVKYNNQGNVTMIKGDKADRHMTRIFFFLGYYMPTIKLRDNMRFRWAELDLPSKICLVLNLEFWYRLKTVDIDNLMRSVLKLVEEWRADWKEKILYFSLEISAKNIHKKSMSTCEWLRVNRVVLAYVPCGNQLGERVPWLLRSLNKGRDISVRKLSPVWLKGIGTIRRESR